MNNPPLDRHRAERVLDVVADALERPPAERAAFLREACGGDEPLWAEVQSLLDQEAGATFLLSAPVFAPAGGRLFGPGPGELQPDDTLGDCRIIRFLGEGGTGEVYLAQDTRLERRVAVKLLKRQFDEGQLLRRFHHERRVLAGLTHPNIARLYGGATTPEGRSYLVMEYIEGERLDRYCEEKGLDVTGRLELFRKVCAAVAYAHQNLVVHRDLKPANVRVTAEGEPKLLDFGIAKLLETEAPAPGSDPTMTMQAMMTPEYASPEQLRGEAITTASDVYSLGVVLYELLTGQRPYAISGRRPDELARAICEQEPLRPSTVVKRRKAEGRGQKVGVPKTVTESTTTKTPPSFIFHPSSFAFGDLDNIAAKALRKEPARRYASVAAFSDDLRRYAEGLPVGARGDTLPYRAGKFVLRNKAGVVAAALVVLALVGGLVATTLEARRANRRFEEVRRLAASLLFEIEPQIANLSGSTQARSTLVKRALEYLDGLSQEAGSRRDLQRELAAAYEKVGDVQGREDQPNLGDHKGALASYVKARGLRRALVAADGRDLAARRELAVCDEHMGVILWWSNQTAAAQSSYAEALALWEGLLAEQPRSPECRRGLASVLVRTADVFSWNAQRTEAAAAYRQALPILQTLLRETPRDTELRLDLATCLENTADMQNEAGGYDEALGDLAQAEQVLELLTREDPNNSTARHSLWYVWYLQTETLLARKATTAALEISPRMLAAAEALALADPGDNAGQHNLAISQEARAVALQQAERWPEALDALQAALSVDAKLAAHSPENGEYAHSCGTYHSEIGRIRLQLGQWAQAEADAQAAQDLLQAAADRDPDNPAPRRDLIPVYELRGDLCEKQAQPVRAKEWFQRGLQEMRALASQKTTPDLSDEWTAFGARLLSKTASESAPVPTP